MSDKLLLDLETEKFLDLYSTTLLDVTSYLWTVVHLLAGKILTVDLAQRRLVYLMIAYRQLGCICPS